MAISEPAITKKGGHALAQQTSGNCRPTVFRHLSTRHTDQTTLSQRDGQARLDTKRTRVLRLDGTEDGKEPEQGIRNLGQGELLAGADARASAERDVLPAARKSPLSAQGRRGFSWQHDWGGGYQPNSQIRFPPLGPELISVRPEYGLVPMKHMRGPPDGHPLRDEDGLGAVETAAAGQDGFLLGCSRV